MSSKVAVNNSTVASDPPFHDQVTRALLDNGGIARIQSALQNGLDAAGWTENVRRYVTELLRSGECTTYDDCVERVRKHTVVSGQQNGTASTNGAAERGLTVPKSAVDRGVEAVKKEIAAVCEDRR